MGAGAAPQRYPGGSNFGGTHGKENIGHFGAGRPQLAFITANNYEAIDEKKTKELFAAPDGGRPSGTPTLEFDPQIPHPYRPIGSSMSVFEYDRGVYFDTFFDGLILQILKGNELAIKSCQVILQYLNVKKIGRRRFVNISMTPIVRCACRTRMQKTHIFV